MNFEIIEQKNYYFYKGKKYKFGNGLLELVNDDFSSFYKCAEKINKNLLENYDNSDKMDIDKFFLPLMELKSSSIYINFFQEYIYQFFKIFDNIDGEGNLIRHPKDELFNLLKNEFVTRLKKLQNNYRNIFDNFFMTDKENLENIINENIYDKFENEYSLYKNTPSQKITIKLNDNKSFSFKVTYYKLEDFCRYEFLKMLENKIKILKCPTCERYFIPKNNKIKYCNTKCQKRFNNNKEKENIYTVLYRKAYQKLRKYTRT